MIPPEIVRKIIASRQSLRMEGQPLVGPRKTEVEGGCGVIGIACSEKIAARHLLQALKQMRNRGNGKGGGIAAVGLVPEELGVSPELLANDYLLCVAYLDPAARAEAEQNQIEPVFEIDHVRSVPHVDDFRALEGLDVQPPEVLQYFVRVRRDVVQFFEEKQGLSGAAGVVPLSSIEDEIVYQNTYELNKTFYASTGEKRAFVLSHGKNMVVLKMVGYGDDVVRYYQLEDLHAHVWIGHHRYPTKGRVWHPGGAHPFVGLHEALVHNGDFANYSSICEYLAQRNIFPLFLTDTEVSVLVFDLLYRTYGYPLEYVIEALAPTTERDFTLLPADKQEIYRMLQTVHIHGSPDGPWFFLIAQSVPSDGASRLIGITDTSMLRPQVFALQQGAATIGFAASEKQAIDAALESLSAEDSRFWTRADRYWNARGGSHTDGGAFIFTVHDSGDGCFSLDCTNKFGHPITVNDAKPPRSESARRARDPIRCPDVPASELFCWTKQQITQWDYDDLSAFAGSLSRSAENDRDRKRAIETLTLLLDRRYPACRMRLSNLRSLLDQGLNEIVGAIERRPSEAFAFVCPQSACPRPASEAQTAVIDARPYPPEGKNSLARQIVELYQRGFSSFLIASAKGHRFIANGLGPGARVRLDVYGSSGDYLASGIDGTEVFVHGNAQDQLAQIMKDGKLVVFGDVGQTFMYGAKGGQAFVLGNAAGRPLINAVGKPRVVINGTCLDYLAESFMAGDPLDNGGFVILNGVAFDDDVLLDLDTPYPGGNLFSLSSGGAIYVRDPLGKVSEEQLNGGEFVPLEDADWNLIKPYLEENELLFGIPLSRLLEVNGKPLPAQQVYRKIRPRKLEALQAEEAWVRGNG